MKQKLVVIRHKSEKDWHDTRKLPKGATCLLYCDSIAEAQTMFEALTSSPARFVPGGADYFWIEHVPGYMTALVWNEGKRKASVKPHVIGEPIDYVPDLDSMQNFCYGIRFAVNQAKRRAKLERTIADRFEPKDEQAKPDEYEPKM